MIYCEYDFENYHEKFLPHFSSYCIYHFCCFIINTEPVIIDARHYTGVTASLDNYFGDALDSRAHRQKVLLFQ